jgi:hypothetical protein
MKTLKQFLEEKKEELERKMNDLSVDFANDFDYKENGWISDDFVEFADQNVDIYYSDLFEWAKGNYSYIEDYVKEYGIDTQSFDFIKIIQGGQYLEKYEELNQDEEEIKALLFVQKMLNLDNEILEQEIEEEIENNIENILNGSWCDLDKYDEYEDIINGVFGWD